GVGSAATRRVARSAKRAFSQMLRRSPVLRSVQPVVRDSRYVRIDEGKLTALADRLAHETFIIPDFRGPQSIQEDTSRTIDYILVENAINFAFTDFGGSHKMFTTTFRGQQYSASQAMEASLTRALENGVPVLDGAFLASLTRAQLAKIFRGN